MLAFAHYCHLIEGTYIVSYAASVASDQFVYPRNLTYDDDIGIKKVVRNETSKQHLYFFFSISIFKFANSSHEMIIKYQ